MVKYKVTFNDDSPYLQHYGVLGMKWGVRHDKQPSGKTRRMAKKDAKRYMEAKAYYGEGAGNRRKKVKMIIEQRKKSIPGYSEEFDRHVENYNSEKAVRKAGRQRAAKDVFNVATGNEHSSSGGRVAKGLMGAMAVYGGLKITGLDKPAIAAGHKIADEVVGNAKSAGILVSMLWKNRR